MSSNEKVTITGTVVGGIGKGAFFISLDWVRAGLRQLMGEHPYPGTLNLRVPVEVRETLFERRKNFVRIALADTEDCPGYLLDVWLRTLNGTELAAWVILPDLTSHTDILEVVSQFCLRTKLGIRDGDPVIVTVRVAAE